MFLGGLFHFCKGQLIFLCVMNTRWYGVQMGVSQEFGAALSWSLVWVPSYSGNAPHLRVLHKDGQKHYTMYFSFSSTFWGIFNRLITFWGMLTNFLKTFSYLSQLQNLFTKQDQSLFIRSHDLEVYPFVSFIGDSMTVEQHWGFLFTHLNRFQYCLCAFSKSSTTVFLYQFVQNFCCRMCVGVPFTVSPVVISTPHLSSPWINPCRTANMQTLLKPTINAMRKTPLKLHISEKQLKAYTTSSTELTHHSRIFIQQCFAREKLTWKIWSQCRWQYNNH
jgi:hypothetical protein